MENYLLREDEMGYLGNHAINEKKNHSFANSFPSQSPLPWILSPAKIITHGFIPEENKLNYTAMPAKCLLASGKFTAIWGRKMKQLSKTKSKEKHEAGSLSSPVTPTSHLWSYGAIVVTKCSNLFWDFRCPNLYKSNFSFSQSQYTAKDFQAYTQLSLYFSQLII